MSDPLAPYPGASLPFPVAVQAAPTRLDIVLRSSAVALAVFGLCVFGQWLVYGKLFDDPEIRFVTPTLASLMTGATTFRMLMQERAYILAFRLRFQAIAEAHHHIRNALQTLSYHGYLTDDKASGQRLNEAVQRIQWVLDEVFPRLEIDKVRRTSSGAVNESD